MLKPIIYTLPHVNNPEFYFEKIRTMDCPIMLDSGHGSTQTTSGRYSIITAEPSARLIQTQQTLRLHHSQGTTDLPTIQLLEHQEALLNQLRPIEDQSLPFTGGIIGYWAYDLNQTLFPNRPLNAPTSEPILILGLYHWAIIIDHVNHGTQLVAHPDMPKERIQHLQASLHAHKPTCKETFHLSHPFQADISYAQYQAAFTKIKEYIRQGDCYQVNFAQRFSSRYQGSLWTAYKRLRQASPAPFSAFLDFPELAVLSLSPEQFLQAQSSEVTTKPIKGTRPRGKTADEDQYLAQQLRDSAKDHAENLMIVDLLRNDLNRNCQPHTVKAAPLFQIESYANVHHLTSTVTGKLRSEISLSQCFLQAFPGGSITGAPKIRAMEIIASLETAARSVYCGSVGYISSNQQMNTSIAIRTLAARQGHICCWGGGAIVDESECHSEYQESMTKINNLMASLEQTQKDSLA